MLFRSRAPPAAGARGRAAIASATRKTLNRLPQRGDASNPRPTVGIGASPLADRHASDARLDDLNGPPQETSKSAGSGIRSSAKNPGGTKPRRLPSDGTRGKVTGRVLNKRPGRPGRVKTCTLRVCSWVFVVPPRETSRESLRRYGFRHGPRQATAATPGSRPSLPVLLSLALTGLPLFPPSWFLHAEPFRGTSRTSVHPCSSACIRG